MRRTSMVLALATIVALVAEVVFSAPAEKWTSRVISTTPNKEKTT